MELPISITLLDKSNRTERASLAKRREVPDLRFLSHQGAERLSAVFPLRLCGRERAKRVGVRSILIFGCGPGRAVLLQTIYGRERIDIIDNGRR